MIKFRIHQLGMIAVVVLLLVGFAEMAQARLVVGRVKDGTGGFPLFVREGAPTRTALSICLDAARFCAPDPQVDANPQSVLTGFGKIAAYYEALVDVRPVANVRLRYRAAVDATYRGGPNLIADGQQIVINSITITIDAPPGLYKVDHPYGTHRITIAPGAVRGRRIIQRLGRIADSFHFAETGPVTFYLKQTAPPDALHIGGIVAPKPVTGSPLRNEVVVTAPLGVNIGGPANSPNILRIRRMTVQGKIR